MGRRTITAVLIFAALASCGRVADSRLNPFNWFERDRETTVTVVTVEDPRPLVGNVVRVGIDRAPGGAILTATGLPARQGYWGGALIPVSETGGVLVLDFRLTPPPYDTRVSTPRSREVTVATFLSDQRLALIREIQVRGQASSRAIRR